MSNNRRWGYILCGVATLGVFAGFVAFEAAVWSACWRTALMIHIIIAVVVALCLGPLLLWETKGETAEPKVPDGIDGAGRPYRRNA